MQTDLFKEQVAVITGAGQGIGFEIARQLCLQGASVVLNDVDAIRAEKAAAQINREDGVCIAIAGDAGDRDTIGNLIRSAVDHFGKLTIAIANAGTTAYGDFFAFTENSFRELVRLNLSGGFFLTQAAARQMKLQQSGGSVLLMSSVTGHQAHKNLAAYGMTKAALEMLARSLVIELSPYQISINAIAPGATQTERTMSDPEYNTTWSNITPMGKPATVNDIAQAALFLVSPGSKHITGQTLIVDGGWTSVSPSPFDE
ncbi:MAG: SDR family oxidoreductase [Terrimonas sp.]|nr:SDR family oxidoreductase [Terrimonas sp.]